MITVAETVLRLTFGNDTGAPDLAIDHWALRCALGGAVLADLAPANRVDTDAETLVLVDPAPPGHVTQDLELARIVSDGRRLPADKSVLELAGASRPCARLSPIAWKRETSCPGRPMDAHWSSGASIAPMTTDSPCATCA